MLDYFLISTSLLIIIIYFIYLSKLNKCKKIKMIDDNTYSEKFTNMSIHSTYNNNNNYNNNHIIENFNENIIATIPTYIISLERATERKEYINRILQNFNFTYFNGVDGSNFKDDEIEMKNFYYQKDTPVRVGQIGCYLSHIKLWKKIVESEHLGCFSIS